MGGGCRPDTAKLPPHLDRPLSACHNTRMNDEHPDFDRNAPLTTLVPDLGDRYDLDGLPPRALQKPVRRLSAGELLGLVDHGIAPEISVPLALDKLEGDAFLQAGKHPGDLLTALLELPATFWQEHYELWLATVVLLGEAMSGIQERAEAEAKKAAETADYHSDDEEPAWLPQFLGDDFMGAVLHFREIHRGE